MTDHSMVAPGGSLTPECAELRAALAALLSSHENYASEHKPESEWDEYDMMMFPRWKKARSLLEAR